MKVVSTILLLTLAIFAQNNAISLTGTVIHEMQPVEGVVVNLLNHPEIKDTTNSDGVFILTNGLSSVRTVFDSPRSHFEVNERKIIFPQATSAQEIIVSLFRADGKKVFTSMHNSVTGNASVILPEPGSGIYMLQVNIDNKVYTQPLFSVNATYISAGNELAAEKERLIKGLAAQLSVDTILAEKEGYSASKVEITDYIADNITIELDKASTECTRELLQGIVDTYIEALEAADASMMPLSDDAHYQENMSTSAFDEDVWTSSLNIAFHRDFFDVDQCMVFTEAFDVESDEAHEVGAQITVDDGKVTMVNALVAGVGDWALKKKSDFEFRRDISSREDWSSIPEEEQDEREVIQAAGDAYLDLFNDENVDVPWGEPCGRLEGNMYTGNSTNLEDPNQSCNIGVPSGVPITDRIYVIDVTLGTVSIFCKFAGAMPDSHLFRIEDGKLRFVHTISINDY